MSNHQPKHLEYSFCFQFLAYGTEENRVQCGQLPKSYAYTDQKAKSEPIN